MSKLSRLGNALYEGDVSIDFVSPRRRRIWYGVSLLIVLVAVLGLYFKGLNLGIEFEGGTSWQVRMAEGKSADIEDVRDVLRVALLFGGFQALMPLLGWLVGARIGPAVEAWDHWIVFALLGGLGAKT